MPFSPFEDTHTHAQTHIAGPTSTPRGTLRTPAAKFKVKHHHGSPSKDEHPMPPSTAQHPPKWKALRQQATTWESSHLGPVTSGTLVFHVRPASLKTLNQSSLKQLLVSHKQGPGFGYIVKHMGVLDGGFGQPKTPLDNLLAGSTTLLEFFTAIFAPRDTHTKGAHIRLSISSLHRFG